MGETRRDGVDEEAYREAERKWQAWQAWESSQARKKKGITESSEEERAIRREKNRDTVRRHYEAKQRRKQAMENGEEIREKAVEKIKQRNEEQHKEQERIAEKEQNRIGIVIGLVCILFAVFGFLSAVFK